MKYAFIHSCNHPKQRLFKLFNVSASGYYDYLKRGLSQRRVDNLKLDAKIKSVFALHKQRYGYRRVHDDLLEMGFKASAERVRKRMQALGLRAIQRRKFKITTDSNHRHPVAANLLAQAFKQNELDRVWATDITYVRVNNRWLYFCSMIDLCSKRVIGWAMDTRIDAQLVCDALKMALNNRNHPQGVIVHSDRGSQYCAGQFQQLIKKNRLISSMSRKGNCYDNAVAESFLKTLKVEEVYQQNYTSMEEAKRSIFYYIEGYYNRKRKHSSLNYRSPVDFENTMLKIANNCP